MVLDSHGNYNTMEESLVRRILAYLITGGSLRPPNIILGALCIRLHSSGLFYVPKDFLEKYPSWCLKFGLVFSRRISFIYTVP